MRKFSFDTTFGVDELASASSQLLNVGVQVNQLQGQLKMLGDIAQGDKQKFAELTSIFAKVQSTGRVTSMQLQQLALRGVPIIQTLKDMGIQGSTSADNLTKAFQKLTDEGGQFHNAMNNIIDTIEGKRGFIEDTLKEIYVNLGKVTGLTDAYKESLDVIYNALDWVNNGLMKLNENPLMKAIITGVATTVVSALATVIAVSLVGALKTVITQLGILDMLVKAFSASNPIGWILLGVGAIAGLTAGIVSYIKSQKQLKEETEKANAEIQKQLDLVYSPVYSRNTRLATQMELLESHNQSKQKLEADIREAEAQKEEYEKVIKGWQNNNGKYSNNEYKEAKGQIEEITKKINGYNEQLEKANVLIENQEQLVKRLKDEISQNDFTGIINDFADLKDTLVSKINGTDVLTDLYRQMAVIEKYKSLEGKTDNEGKIISYDDKQKAEIDKLVNYLQTQINDVKWKIKLENADDWQKELQKLYGFDDKTLGKLIDGTKNGGTSGAQVTKDYLSKLATKYLDREVLDTAFGLGKASKNYVMEQAEDVLGLYEKLADTGLFSASDGTMKELWRGLDNLKNKFIENGGTVDEWNEKIRGILPQETDLVDDLNNKLEEQKDIWQELTENMSEYFQKLGVKKINADLFAQTLTDITKTQIPNGLLNGFEAIGKALQTGADAGDALKKQFMSFVSQMLKSLSLTCLQAGVNLIAQSGWAGVPPALALFALGGVGGLASGFVGSLADTSQNTEHVKQVKDLTDSYKGLIKAIKEQEEYYIKKKAELNMLALDDKVTKVNDMILSPHGAFSTNPNDTIIATKNPQGLGGVTNNIKVINNAGVNVDVRENKGNGLNEIIVNISRKIASDVAEGLNGWDGAMALQQQRISGRRI